MKKQNLLYLFPTNFEHKGLAIKARGQVEGLSAYFNVKLYPFLYKRSGSALSKLFASMWYQKWAGIQALFYNRIYIRYNPKMAGLNAWLFLLSYFKPVYFEHNINLIVELAFLNRSFELWLHQHTVSLFRFSRIIHVSVSPALNQHIQSFGISPLRALTIQNGYRPTPFNPEKVNHAIVQKVKALKEIGHTVAIFSGSGSGWHGIENLSHLFSTHPQVILLLAGPYEKMVDLPRVIPLGTLGADTLTAVYELCDFGVGAWNLDTKAMPCPLKTREYMCFGLPILVNYDDCAQEFEVLKPYIFDYSQSKQALEDCLSFSGDRDRLKKLAQDCFSWSNLLRPLAKDSL